MSATVLYSFYLQGLYQLQFSTVSPCKVYVSYSSVQFLPNGEPYSWRQESTVLPLSQPQTWELLEAEKGLDSLAQSGPDTSGDGG